MAQRQDKTESESARAACHSFSISDIHLADAQEPDPRRPLWKRFKSRELFVDDSLARCLEHMRELAGPGADIELILNGDIFDFDSVMAIPEQPSFAVHWLERLRGLDAEADKSLFKIQVILREHPGFVAALRDFLLAGHEVVFVIGNHDMELHWPAVQAHLRASLDLPDEAQTRLRFCEWFVLCNEDSLFEHGHQYDSYCVATDPVSPRIRWRGHERLRLPFGNVAGKLMLNGMGLFNPHVESSFILSLREYVVFFFRYVIRVQPWLAWSWLWSSLATLVLTLREGLRPALRDPATLDDRVEDIARRARATPRMVRALAALRVPPAHTHPWRVLRELWLDRALLLALLLFGTFQLFSFLNVFVSLPLWWWPIFFALVLPPLIFYARSVHSDVDNYERGLRRRLPDLRQISGVRRVIMGHTHVEKHVWIDGVELLNTGTWSSAYHDVECTRPFGRTCFAWLRPSATGGERVAELREWCDPGSRVIPCSEDSPPTSSALSEGISRIRERWQRPPGQDRHASRSGPALNKADLDTQ